MEIFELEQRNRVDAVFKSSYWHNPGLQGQTKHPLSPYKRIKSLDLVSQAFRNYPPLLADQGVVDEMVQAGLWFAGEPAIDRFVFNSVGGPSAAQRAGFSRLLNEHPAFCKEPGRLNNPEYRADLCGYVKTVLEKQPSWRNYLEIAHPLVTARERFPGEPAVQALVKWAATDIGQPTDQLGSHPRTPHRSLFVH